MTYQYWKTNELQHSGVKGMRWGVRKKYDKISNKERNYRNAKRKMMVAAGANLAGVALTKAALYKFANTPQSSNGIKLASAITALGGASISMISASKLGKALRDTLSTHMKYAKSLDGKEKTKEWAKIIGGAGGVVGIVALQTKHKDVVRLLGKMTIKATPYAYSAGKAARQVVNNVSKAWQHITSRPYGYVKDQKAYYRPVNNLLHS